MSHQGAEPEVADRRPHTMDDGIGDLLTRMKAGDRQAAAQFMDRFGSRIRRRVRGRLRPAMRRLFDSQEIISTLSRRLDAFVAGGRLAACSENQLWALIFRMAENAVIDKARVFRSLQSVENGDGFAALLVWRLREAEQREPEGPETELNRAFAALEDRTDREILSLWLHDTPHYVTANILGLSPAAVRKRWETIKRRLRPVLTQEVR